MKTHMEDKERENQHPLPSPIPSDGNMTDLFCVIGQLGNGGTERQLFLFLQSLDRTRFRPRVIVSGKEGGIWENRIRQLNVNIDFLGTGLPILKLAKFYLLVRKYRPAVIFSWSFFTNGFWLASGPSVRFIGSLRQSLAYSKIELNRLRFRINLSVKSLVVNSPSIIEELHGESFPDQNIHLVNNIYIPVLKADRKPKEEIRRAFGIPTDAIVILGVGRDSPSKDFPFFVNVLKRVLTDDRRTHAWIIGTGGPVQKDEIRRLGLTDRFTLSGEIPDARTVMHAADIFFLSSRCEGFANVLLEATDAGCAIVSTGVNGVYDFFQDANGVEAWIVTHGNVDEAADRIGTLVKNSMMRDAFASGAKKRLTRFSREESMKTYLEVIDGK
jgi:glycosyltransferase involved in cell wall biosynthesis